MIRNLTQCKQAIDTDTDGICEKCNFGIPCGECNKCACDNPSSKLYAKVHGNNGAKDDPITGL